MTGEHWPTTGSRHPAFARRSRSIAHVVLCVLFASPAALAQSSQPVDPWSEWPYRVRLRVVERDLADFTGMGQVELNLGPRAAADLADVRVLDDKGREQPWYLRSQNATGDVAIVFRTIREIHDYDLLFGKPGEQRPEYGVKWPIGRVLTDDFLEKDAHTHGLWLWVKHPTVSGTFAHTSPLLDRIGFHGTSEIHEQAVYEGTVLHQYVMIDREHPPGEILMQFSFAQRPNEGDWERKSYLLLTWGKGDIRGLSGTRLRMGDLPEPGKWHRLTLDLPQLAYRAGIRSRNGTLYLYGFGFATDRGRAYWDLTTVRDVPARVEVVALERRRPDAPYTFIHRRGHVFTLGETKRVLTEARFFPTAAAACSWDFGDGSSSTLTTPVHVFDSGKSAKVTLRLSGREADPVEVEVPLAETARRRRDFAIDLVSLPLIVRAHDKALFNLRLEGELEQPMDVDVVAVLLDVGGRELRREPAALTMLPGEKHPTFRAFSLDVAEPDLARVTFRLLLHGRTLAEREVIVYNSTSDLADVALSGDRYLDRFKRDAFIRCGLEGDLPKTVSRGLPLRTVILGDLPTGTVPVEVRLAKAVAAADPTLREAKVERPGVSPLPAWSLPYRQTLDVAGGALRRNTDVVIIASAAEMMLAGIPARTGVDAVSVCIDQVRRRTDAEILLLTPTVYSELEDLSRQYAVGLRMLGIEKNVRVIDVYSRSLQLGGKNPDLLKTEKVSDGFLVHELHPEITDMVVSTVVEQLRNPPKVIQVSP